MNPYETALIAGMAIITFAIRYTMFAVGHRVHFSPLMIQALSYVPVVVLTAIVAPAMLMPDGANLDLALDNAYLMGGIAAIIIAARWRNLLATIIGGLAFFFIWRWLCG